MFKPNNKKTLTVLITVAMVFSAIAVLSLAAQPAYAASSGSFTLNPTVFAVTSSTVVVANGGSFTAGSTITFYANLANTFPTGEISLGTVTLPAGQTTLSNTVVTFNTAGLTAGDTYYTAATDGNGYASGPQITAASISPSITLSGSSAAGGTGFISGSSFDPASTVTVYLSYPGGTVLVSTIKATTGSFSDVAFTVPTDLAQGTYKIVAQESSSASSNYGITADASLSLTASIVVSPVDIAPSSVSTVTITGYGFEASAAIAANSIGLNPVTGTPTNPAVTTSSTGGFTVTETFSSVGQSGPVTVTVTTSPASSTSSFPDAFYISQPNPANLGFSFGSVTYVGDPVSAAVWNFPAGQTVQISLDSVVVGSVTTDSNGFGQLPSTTTVPAIIADAAGVSYTPIASVPSMGLYALGTSQTIKSYFQVVDPSGNLVTTSEFIPNTANLTVQAYGLDPSTSYDVFDSLAAPSPTGVFASGLVVSVAVGVETSTALYPASNGTLIFTYTASFSSSVSTGTTSSITMSHSVVPQSGSFGYAAVGPVTINTPSSFALLPKATATGSISLSGLIPSGSAVYPGLTYYYNAYIGSNELTVTSSSPTLKSEYLHTSGIGVYTLSGTYIVPSLSGVYNFSITYNGTPVTSAVASNYVVLSIPGTSSSAGSISAVSTTSGFEVAGYGYSTTPSVYYMTYGGGKQTLAITYSPTTGGFTGLIATSVSNGEPSGTYSIFSEITVSGTNYFVYSSYTVTPSLSITGATSTTLASGNVGSTLTATAYSLQPLTYYNVYFGNSLTSISPIESSSAGTLTTSQISFTVPVVPAGTYEVKLTTLNSTSAVVSSDYKVKENPSLSLTTVVPQYAFPGEIVQFSVNGLSLPPSPTNYLHVSGTYLVTGYQANVSLNDTLFATVPATFQIGSGGTTYLNGSFVMPNYNKTYFELTISGLVTYTNYLGGSILGSSTSLTQATVAMIGSQSDFIGLIEGNGMLLTGISPGEIATLELAINNTVTSSLKVPIAELNAAITSINGAVANLKTVIGNVTVALSTINATVLTIQKGVVTLSTELGNVQTSLASINATLVSFNGSIASLKTSVGTVQASLSAINTTVTAISGKTATIQTSLGTLTGTVTSMNGTVATINTKLGTLTANVGSLTTNVTKLSSPVNTLEIFEIVILVLVLITLVLSFLAISNVNKVARKVEEQKKQ